MTLTGHHDQIILVCNVVWVGILLESVIMFFFDCWLPLPIAVELLPTVFLVFDLHIPPRWMTQDEKVCGWRLTRVLWCRRDLFGIGSSGRTTNSRRAQFVVCGWFIEHLESGRCKINLLSVDRTICINQYWIWSGKMSILIIFLQLNVCIAAACSSE